MLVSGAECIAAILQHCGVSLVFGAPGTTELSLVAALTKQTNIKYFTVLSDSVAVGCADGFARASSRLGVANLHSSQGTLNAMGYIRAAYRDNSPILIIAGTPSTTYRLNEPNHFLLGLPDLMRSVTKWSWEVGNMVELSQAVRRAARLALSEPYGPVFLGIPQDILESQISTDLNFVENLVSQGYSPVAECLQKAMGILVTAQNPVIFAGNGVGQTGCVRELIALAETLGAPVVSEALDRGPSIHSVNFPYDHPLSLGYFDRRDRSIRRALATTDAMLMIGCKATYPRVIGRIPQGIKIIQIDNNIAEIGKNHPVEVALTGSIKLVLRELTDLLVSNTNKENQNSVVARIKVIHKLTQGRLARRTRFIQAVALRGLPIVGEQLAKALVEVLTSNTVIVDDSQCMGYYLKHYFPFSRQGSLFGSMASHIGWALPASLGIKLALPQSLVVCIVSDGSLWFSIQALATAVKYDVPIIIIVANNRGFMSLKLEMLKKNYSLTKDGLNLMELNRPEFDYSRIAYSMGVQSKRVVKAEELLSALGNAVKTSGPFLLDVVMSPRTEDWERSWYVAPPR